MVDLMRTPDVLLQYGSKIMNAVENEVYPTTVKEIGLYIRAIRKQKRLSQQEICNLSGVNRRFLSELENGKVTAESGKMLHVLRAIGCDVILRYRQ